MVGLATALWRAEVAGLLRSLGADDEVARLEEAVDGPAEEDGSNMLLDVILVAGRGLGHST